MTVCLVAALAVAPLVHAAGTASPIAFVVSPIPDQTISSIAELFVGVTPSVTVSNMAISAELTLGTDYTVTYTDNKSIGSACAVVAGCGEYAAYT